MVCRLVAVVKAATRSWAFSPTRAEATQNRSSWGSSFGAVGGAGILGEGCWQLLDAGDWSRAIVQPGRCVFCVGSLRAALMSSVSGAILAARRDASRSMGDSTGWSWLTVWRFGLGDSSK